MPTYTPPRPAFEQGTQLARRPSPALAPEQLCLLLRGDRNEGVHIRGCLAVRAEDEPPRAPERVEALEDRLLACGAEALVELAGVVAVVGGHLELACVHCAALLLKPTLRVVVQVHDQIFIRDNARTGSVKVRLDNR